MNDATYAEYRELCIDRGIFPLGRAQTAHMTPDQWITYVTSIIRDRPSRAERIAAGEIVPERL